MELRENDIKIIRWLIDVAFKSGAIRERAQSAELHEFADRVAPESLVEPIEPSK